jgi:hypothetical protein
LVRDEDHRQERLPWEVAQVAGLRRWPVLAGRLVLVVPVVAVT